MGKAAVQGEPMVDPSAVFAMLFGRCNPSTFSVPAVATFHGSEQPISVPCFQVLIL